MNPSETMIEVSSRSPLDPIRTGPGPGRPAAAREPESRSSEGRPGDTVSLSPEAQALAEAADVTDVPGETIRAGSSPAEAEAAESESDPEAPGELTPEEQEVVAELQARDREVRAHEQAHASVGGALAGSPSYEYESGPDGRRYAVAGEVPIELREGRTPEETLRNAQTVRRAALAPAEPSPQDRSVAAAASQMEARARSEINEERAEEATEGGESGDTAGSASGTEPSSLPMEEEALPPLERGPDDPDERQPGSSEAEPGDANRDLKRAAATYRAIGEPAGREPTFSRLA